MTPDFERALHGSVEGGGADPRSSDGTSIPTPLTDGDANWVDALTIMAVPPFDPSRFSSPRYWRRLIVTLVLVVAAEAVVLVRFGLVWWGLGFLLIAMVAFIELRWGRTPLLTLWALTAPVAAFVIPQDNSSSGTVVAGHAPSSPTCGLLSTQEVAGLLEHPTRTPGQSPASPRCAWSSATHAGTSHPSAGQAFTLAVSAPDAVPLPPAGASHVGGLGLRAWMTTGCLASLCRQELDVVLTASFVTLTVTSNDSTQTAWEDGDPGRRSELMRLATAVERRIDRGQCAFPGEDDCAVT